MSPSEFNPLGAGRASAAIAGKDWQTLQIEVARPEANRA
jgi:hypothetical protein